MDGVEMLLKRVLSAMGVKPEDIDMVKAEIPKLQIELPKLRTAIPAFGLAIQTKVDNIEFRLHSIEVKLDLLLSVFNEHITSQALPPVQE